MLAGLACCAVLSWAALPAEAVHLRGQVVRVGFQGGCGVPSPASGDFYRVGRWTPVLVELVNDDGDQFDGRIEVRQRDADGDEVVARLDVSVRGTRRFYLYVPGGAPDDASGGYTNGFGYDGPAPFSVHVYDSSGRLAKLHDDKDQPISVLAPPRQVIPAPANSVVVLDISRRTVNQLDRLNDPNRPTRAVVMHLGQTQLPDATAGYDMVDAIVWDAPQPSSLDGVQNEALLEWVLRGGKLIVGVGKDWNVLAASKFGPYLPAHLGGTKPSSESQVLQSLLDDSAENKDSKLPDIAYCPMPMSSLASDARAVRPRSPKGDEQIWIARRSCGRGQIILVPAALQDLFSVAPKDDSLLRDLLPQARRYFEADSSQGRMDFVDVFSRVAAQTAFQTTSGFYFTFAFGFVIAYIVVVTAGSWGWLKRKNAVRHAWVLSAFIAAAASGLSLAAVQVVRTIGQGVHEMTVVDGRAGSFEAEATSYLGLKTASHTVTDLCVPSKWLQPAEDKETRAQLRPQVSEGLAGQQSRFSVPRQYEGVATLGELRSVPIRATLKQFEAAWRGTLDGRVTASLRRRGPQDGRLDASSWIENQLGTNLHDCYVITRTSTIPLVYVIPKLGNGERVTWSPIDRFMEEEYKQTHKPGMADKIDELTGEKTKPEAWSPPNLRAMLGQCMSQLAVADTRDAKERRREQGLLAVTAPPYVPSLLLLSFFNDPVVMGLTRPGEELVRSHGQQLDISSTWEGDTAVFIGFSEDPGPLRLCRRSPDSSDVDDWKAIKPARSVVMYRFFVPVQ